MNRLQIISKVIGWITRHPYWTGINQ